MRVCLQSKPATPTLLADYIAAAATQKAKKMATKEVLVQMGVHSRVIHFDDKGALYSNGQILL